MLAASQTWSLTAIAVLSGVALLWIWKWLGRPERSQAANRQVRARLYAIRLYGDEPALAMRAQAQLLAWTARYMAAMWLPAVVSGVVFLILLAGLDNMYGHRPLRRGESAVVTAEFGNDAFDPHATLEGRGLSVETEGLRVPSQGEVCWRIRITAPESTLRLRTGRKEIREAIHCGYGPALPPIAWGGRPELQCACPTASLNVWGFAVDWRLWLILVSLVTMVALRHPFHVVL